MKQCNAYLGFRLCSLLLKRKASRLRDWNIGECLDIIVRGSFLKRKASRLRDWNVEYYGLSNFDYFLEKKSISITRLKRTRWSSASGCHGPWKEKHLDYEIETVVKLISDKSVIILEKKSISITRLKLFRLNSLILTILNLKRKASRLRDWNDPGYPTIPGTLAGMLEKKSISITRLKLSMGSKHMPKTLPLEKKSISITRLKRHPHLRSRATRKAVLKRKASRLRDWNHDLICLLCLGGMRLKRKASRLRDWNSLSYRPKTSVLPSWKEKHLDYEIETYQHLAHEHPLRWAWKEKHLDYEIETRKSRRDHRHLASPWKEKHLDYEIETSHQVLFPCQVQGYLKRKASRLRDWNPPSRQSNKRPDLLEKKSISITRLKPTIPQSAGSTSEFLKRKASRLRDWNSDLKNVLSVDNFILEKKSISITRLKHASLVRVLLSFY